MNPTLEGMYLIIVEEYRISIGRVLRMLVFPQIKWVKIWVKPLIKLNETNFNKRLGRTHRV